MKASQFLRYINISLACAIAASALFAISAMGQQQSGTAGQPAKSPMAGTVYNVRDYGAVGDGVAVDSDAVNKAITAASAAGGGTVYFPAGHYYCFSIRLASNITLYLDQGCELMAADTPREVLALQPRGNGRGARGSNYNIAPAPVSRGGAPVAVAQGTGAAPAAASAPAADTAQPAPAASTATGVEALQNSIDFPPTLQPAALQGILSQIPAGTKMYDLAEANEWTNAPASQQYQDFGHSHWQNSLIWGDGLTNISILGPGTINGRTDTQGHGLSRADGPTNIGGANKAIALKNCRNVIFRDFTIQQGGWYCLLATGVDNFTLSNIKVDTVRDGFDIDCCKNVRISDCTINSPADDGIVLKSSYALGMARSTDNVTITNCQVSGYNVGTLLDGTYQPFTGRSDGGGQGTGRIKFGTESNGGFKNITISNCVFIRCRGLALESVDGGNIEDITVDNITMRDIVNSPIYIRLGERLRGPKDTTTVGEIKRVNISNVSVSNAYNGSCIIIAGTAGHPIEDVRLSNIRIDYQGNAPKEYAQINPPENESQFYPEPARLGTMPAYGMFLRHVKGLEMDDIKVSYAYPDFRPAAVLDDVDGVEFDNLRAQHEDGIPTFMLWNTSDFTVARSPGIADQHIDKMAQGVVAK